MDKLVESIVDALKSIKRPTLWLVIIVIVSLFIIAFPYIDHYFFFYERTIKRVELLEQITSLDLEEITKDKRLTEEYNLIIEDIQKQGRVDLSGLDAGTVFIPTTNQIQLWKFISGASLLWILAIWVLFMNTFKKRSEKILAFFMVIILSGIAGWISYIIPTFYAPAINYLIVPVLLTVILIALIKSNKKKQ